MAAGPLDPWRGRLRSGPTRRTARRHGYAGPAPVAGLRLALHPRGPGGSRGARLRRRRVANARPSARLERRGPLRSERADRGRRWLSAHGRGLVPPLLRLRRRVAGPPRHHRAGRGLPERGRLDQRPPPRPPTERVRELRVRSHAAPDRRRQRGGRARRQLAAAELEVVLGERDLPARLARGDRSAARGPVGHVRDHPRGRGHGRRRGRAHHAGERRCRFPSGYAADGRPGRKGRGGRPRGDAVRGAGRGLHRGGTAPPGVEPGALVAEGAGVVHAAHDGAGRRGAHGRPDRHPLRDPHRRLRRGARLPPQRRAGEDARRQPASRRRARRRGGPRGRVGATPASCSRGWASTRSAPPTTRRLPSSWTCATGSGSW